jgi:hypothetical protein
VEEVLHLKQGRVLHLGIRQGPACEGRSPSLPWSSSACTASSRRCGRLGWALDGRRIEPSIPARAGGWAAAAVEKRGSSGRDPGPDIGGEGEAVTDCWRAAGREELAAAGGGIGSGHRSEVA